MKTIFTMLGVFLSLSSFVQAAPTEKLQDCKQASDVQRNWNMHFSELSTTLGKILNVPEQGAQSRIKVARVGDRELQNLHLKQTDTECQYWVGDQVIIEYRRLKSK